MNEPSEKIKRVLRHCQTMNVLVGCLEIEMAYDLHSAKFTDPRVNNHIRRIKESLGQIELALAFAVKHTNREQMKYDHHFEMHRLFRYFGTMETNQLRSILDQYEQFDRENPPTEIVEPSQTES